jgi:hypothetical protein
MKINPLHNRHLQKICRDVALLRLYVKAYDSYIQDAQQVGSQPCVELFEKLRSSDMEQAQEIRQHLQQVMQQGKM